MKITILLMIMFLLFLPGCGINNSNLHKSEVPVLSIYTENATNDIDSKDEIYLLPDIIDLTFNKIEMEELQEGGTATDWKYVRSITFGEIANSNVVLEIYEVTTPSVNQINGVLKLNNNQFLMFDLPTILIENDLNGCTQVCIFQRYFSNEERYKLIGTVDISLNGPGLKKYLIYDETNGKIFYFDLWGEPIFIDLDADGNDEFIIQFQGLHLSWPDISIIRLNGGELEISTSVFNTIQKNEGDFAILINDKNPPMIGILNAESENEAIYNYTYHQGVLVKSR